MLCLGIRKDEDIVIQVPGRIPLIVKLLGIDRGQARLGFVAQNDIRIDRAAVYASRSRGETTLPPKEVPDGD